MKLLIINGPNLNMLGVREPGIYGQETYESLITRLKNHCAARGVYAEFTQSNHEGSLLDEIQRAYYEGFTGIVINPGAYTHTSIALLDAVKSTCLPVVEVHISDPDSREKFRHISYIGLGCVHTIKGHGTDGYVEAIDYLIDNWGDKK